MCMQILSDSSWCACYLGIFHLPCARALTHSCFAVKTAFCLVSEAGPGCPGEEPLSSCAVMMVLHFLSGGGKGWKLLAGGGWECASQRQRFSSRLAAIGCLQSSPSDDILSGSPHFPHKTSLQSGTLSLEPHSVDVLGSFCLQLQPGCVRPGSKASVFVCKS